MSCHFFARETATLCRSIFIHGKIHFGTTRLGFCTEYLNTSFFVPGRFIFRGNLFGVGDALKPLRFSLNEWCHGKIHFGTRGPGFCTENPNISLSVPGRFIARGNLFWVLEWSCHLYARETATLIVWFLFMRKPSLVLECWALAWRTSTHQWCRSIIPEKPHLGRDGLKHLLSTNDVMATLCTGARNTYRSILLMGKPSLVLERGALAQRAPTHRWCRSIYSEGKPPLGSWIALRFFTLHEWCHVTFLHGSPQHSPVDFSHRKTLFGVCTEKFN